MQTIAIHLDKGVKDRESGGPHKVLFSKCFASLNQAVTCRAKHIDPWFPSVQCQEQYTYDEGLLSCETLCPGKMSVTSLCQPF